MKTCPKCNAQLPDDAQFCNECGASVSNVSANAANNTAEKKDADKAPENTAKKDDAAAPNNNSAAPTKDASAAEKKDDAANNANNANAGAADPNGTNFAQNGAEVNGAPAPAGGLDLKKINLKDPKILGMCACAVVALIVLIILISSAANGYKKPVNQLVSLANKRSTNVVAYMECATPKFVSSSFKSLMGCIKGGDAKKELEGTIKDAFEDAWDDAEDEFGKNWKISIEWKDADKLSDKKLDDLKDQWENLADMVEKFELDDEDNWESISDMLDDKYDSSLNTKQAASIMEKFVKQLGDAKIQAAYNVDLKLTIRGKDGKDTTKIEDLIIVKVNGQWIIDPTSLLDQSGMSVNSLLRLAGSLY